MGKKVINEDMSYSIISHGGIGNEHGESNNGDIVSYNLSGSCHELQIKYPDIVYRILIDFGAYQGQGLLERNMKEVIKGVMAIILTHPHNDHTGDLPIAFTDESEFEGKVIATPGTKQSLGVSLPDNAKIKAAEYEKRKDGYIQMLQEIASALFVLKSNKPGSKKVKKHQGNRMSQTGDIPNHKQDILDAHATLAKYGVDIDSEIGYKEQMKKFEPEKPSFNMDDVINALASIELHTIKDAWKEIVPGRVAIRFYNAGHIIGSVSVLFRITQNRKNRYVLFSGDVGSYKWDFHPTGLAVPPHDVRVETVVVETTYGTKVRPDFSEGALRFEANMKYYLDTYGEIIIPAFAMDRMQNILYRLIKLKQEGKIDADIFLDSPTGAKHTLNYFQQAQQVDDTILMRHPPGIHKSLREDFMLDETNKLREFAEYINPANGHYTIVTKMNRKSLFEDSKKKRIILTASGMADGGMIVSHLEKGLSNPKKVFYFTGYLVPGTLGHRLVNPQIENGQIKPVLINGKYINQKAIIIQDTTLSGHGDYADMTTFLGSIPMREGTNILGIHGDIHTSTKDFIKCLGTQKKFSDKNLIVSELGVKYDFPLIEKKKK